MKFVFGLICDDVRFELGGKISIIGECNLLQLPQIPLTVPFCVLSKWAGSPGAKGTVTLQMISPDSLSPVLMGLQELELGTTEFDTAFGGTVNKIPWQFQATGVHIIQILLDGQEQARLELLIKKSGQSIN